MYHLLTLCKSITFLFLYHENILNTCVLPRNYVIGKFRNIGNRRKNIRIKNVYVLNSFGSSGVGFCAREIKVNGVITTDETNSSSFEIDLAALKLKYGQSVTIEIDHSEGCTPKVLNMEDLKPKPTFEIMTMNISPSGLLKWSANNETGSLPYIIEQFKWNKWVPIGEIQGVGTPEKQRVYISTFDAQRRE